MKLHRTETISEQICVHFCTNVDYYTVLVAQLHATGLERVMPASVAQVQLSPACAQESVSK